MPIKVLYVIDHLSHGGGATSVKSIVENVDKNLITPFVCVLRPKKLSVQINANVTCLKYGKFDPRAVFAVEKLCRKHDIDIVHPQLAKSVIVCLLANFICRTPVIVHERGDIFREGLSLCAYRLLLRLLRHRAALVIANSRATANCLLNKAKIAEHNIKVLHNAIDFNFFDPARVSRSGVKDELNISDNDFVIGFIGRLHRHKGVDILIEAMAVLLQDLPDYLLVLLGDGPERQSLEARCQKLGIADRVKFLGARDNAPEIISTFDVSVVPSRLEPFGRVVIELMRMKIPVISSGADGMAELVTDGVNGLITDENTPQGIYQAVRRLAKDAKLREKLRNSACLYSEQFSIKKHIKKLEEIYINVLQREGTRKISENK